MKFTIFGHFSLPPKMLFLDLNTQYDTPYAKAHVSIDSGNGDI